MSRVKTVASMVLRLVVVAAVGLVAGSIMVNYGVDRLRDPRVTCGAHVMKPGDTCTYPDDDGATVKDDYEGMKTNQATEGYVLFIFGGAVIVAGGGAGAVALFGRDRLAARIARRRRPDA